MKILIVIAFLLSAVHAQQPNIIFILTDDLGYGDLGVLWQNQQNGVTIKTSGLDQMAAEGLILKQHYVPAPVCAPSRGSLLTGLHQGHANVRDNQFDKALENNHNVANTLKKAGYYTALVGKYGLQGEGDSPANWSAYPTKRGFDYYYGYVRHADGHQHYPANRWEIGDSDKHKEKKEVWENGTEVSSGLTKCYTGDLFTAKAKHIIKDRTQSNPNQPFFLFLAYDIPHAALQLPTMAYPDGNGLNGGMQWLGTPGNMINTAAGTIDSYRDPLYTGKGLTDIQIRYATSITRIDRMMEDLLATIRDLEIDDNTLVVFSSDNGPSKEHYIQGGSYSPEFFKSYGPFEGIKRDTYEGGIRVPTLAWGPGLIPGNRVSENPSQFHDWMATFIDFAGVEIPSRLDGVSLKPELTGTEGQNDNRITYIEYFNNGSTPNYSDFTNHKGSSRKQMQVIFLDGYKGIRTIISSHADDFEIYDVKIDLVEANDLAGTSTLFDELQQKMKDRILQIRMPNSSAERPYDNEVVPAVSGENPVPGILAQTYEGSWDWVPEYRNMTEKGRVSIAGFNLDNLTRTNDAGILFTVYISIPTTGDWTFYTTVDGGAIFKIHDKLVLDADFGYDGSEVSQTVKLQAGLHPFRYYYRTGDKPPALVLQWSGPGTAKASVSADRLKQEKEPITSVVSHPLVRPVENRGNRTVDGKLRPNIKGEKWWKLF